MRTVPPHAATYGALTVTAYDFLAEGDELPEHAHQAADNHISIVTVGTLLAFGDRGERVVRAGEIIDWNVGEMHGLRFHTRPARLVNILKGGA